MPPRPPRALTLKTLLIAAAGAAALVAAAFLAVPTASEYAEACAGLSTCLGF